MAFFYGIVKRISHIKPWNSLVDHCYGRQYVVGRFGWLMPNIRKRSTAIKSSTHSICQVSYFFFLGDLTTYALLTFCVSSPHFLRGKIVIPIPSFIHFSQLFGRKKKKDCLEEERERQCVCVEARTWEKQSDRFWLYLATYHRQPLIETYKKASENYDGQAKYHCC